MGNAFDPAHFRIYDNNLLVNAVYDKEFEEENIGLWQFASVDRSASCLSLPLANA